MAKITRKKLARGIKLMPEHVYPPLTSAASQLSGVAVEKEQMQRPMAPFCVNLTLPYISSDSEPAGTVSIPFALPPTQDVFATSATAAGGKTPNYTDETATMKLKSISFSFDQRGEPAAIASNFWTKSGTDTNTGKFGYSDQQGTFTYDDVTKLNISLSLQQKTQHYFGDAYPYTAEKQLWATVIPATAYSGRSLRANPFLQTDLDVAVDPYKTFILVISCPGLADADGRQLTLPSVEVSLKFVTELLPRDSGQAAVQNIPADGGSGSAKYGAKTGPSVTINTPGAGSPVEADSTDGVGYNIATLDEQFQDKLEGGYNRFGDVPPSEVITDDAAYEVIAVPLYQNSAHGGISAAPVFFATYPYASTTGPYASPTANVGLFDRRIIPIHHSYTIHHAILAWNWSPWSPLNWRGANSTAPISGSGSGATSAEQQRAWLACPAQGVGLQVGVGIGTGSGADGFGYEQVATLSITNPNNYDYSAKTPKDADGPATTGTWDTNLIDRITSTKAPPYVQLWNSGGTAAVDGISKWNWELHSIPLVGVGGFSGGAGYHAQGKEIFTGPGWSRTASRTNVGSGTGDTDGAEQWIEVRANLYPTDASKSLPTSDYQFDNTKDLGDKSSILVGYGGCYVYLICKKHLTR